MRRVLSQRASDERAESGTGADSGQCDDPARGRMDSSIHSRIAATASGSDPERDALEGAGDEQPPESGRQGEDE